MKNKIPLLLVATLSLAVASLAHAGKAERDFFAAEVAPALKPPPAPSSNRAAAM